jgi:hypothetical protein
MQHCQWLRTAREEQMTADYPNLIEVNDDIQFKYDIRDGE